MSARRPDRGGEPGDGRHGAAQLRGRVQVVRPAAHAGHQVDALAEIGDERRMGVRRQRPDPPVGGARLRMGEHGGSGWRDCWPGIARLLAGPLAVQGAELVVDVDQIAG